MQKVFVLNRKKQPLMPTHPARARQLLRNGRAVVEKRVPFTIRLKDRWGGEVQSVRFKIAPSRRSTGLGIVRETGESAEVLHLSVVSHKTGVRRAMDRRRNYRRRRRCANLRYRAPRFKNRRRKPGWLQPTLRSRVDGVMSQVTRYRKRLPIAAISVETVKFDPTPFQSPRRADVTYQKGRLMGYEVREYLLEKWGRRCAYCGATGVRLQVEHILPTSRGGTDRLSNLTLACPPCNRRKSNRTAAEFGFPAIQAQAARHPTDLTGISRTRWALYRMLREIGLPLELGSRGRTKYNRIRRRLPMHKAVEALCVGTSTPAQFVGLKNATVLKIEAMGRGRYCRTNVDKHGFPRGGLMRQKMVRGFMTGDLVHARIPIGRYAGTYQATVVVRKSGYFDLRREGKRVAQGISARYCQRLQRFDGYGYHLERMM